jgi:NADPH2:quinone reductase
MRAAWYDRHGSAREVLQVGDIADPEPETGEVLVRLRFSGVNPGDTKKRSGWRDNPMAYPRVVPHSDGAGVIDQVGPGVDAWRIGERAWVWGAQSYRPMGTAAEYTVVPANQAIALPEQVSDEVGACLGIPGITAHRAVFGDGPVDGATVLVHGVRGAVGSLAAQLALWGGATVIGTVRHRGDIDDGAKLGMTLVPLDGPDVAARIRDAAPDGVDRVIEVSLSDNVDLDAAVLRVGGVIAAYASGDSRPSMPFWPMLFDNVTIRLLGSDDFPASAKDLAAADLTRAAQEGALSIAIGLPFRLDDIADAHDAVEAGVHSRVLLTIEQAIRQG